MLEPVQVGGVTVEQGDAPQRGGPRPQGHPRGRRGGHHAGRGRDPAGRLADHPAPHRQGEAVRAAGEVPGVRDSDRQAGGRGLDPLPEPQGLPRPDRPGAQALRRPAGAMDIEGYGEKLVLPLLRRGPGARAARHLPARRSSGSSRWRASSAGRPRTSCASIERSKRPAVPPRAVRARHPGHRRRQRARARRALRLDRPAAGRLEGGDRGGRGHGPGPRRRRSTRPWPSTATGS